MPDGHFTGQSDKHTLARQRHSTSSSSLSEGFTIPLANMHCVELGHFLGCGDLEGISTHKACVPGHQNRLEWLQGVTAGAGRRGKHAGSTDAA
jgi:hypothetical protein